jgi:hypothetical protein
MMSEVKPPTHGANPPQLVRELICENTWTAMMLAPLATPENCCPAKSPLPAAMPATWVP